MSGAASVGVGSGVGDEVSFVSVGELVDGESGMNGPTIAPTIMMNAMPPHPREVFFEATCSAYAVGVTLFGKLGGVSREDPVASAAELQVPATRARVQPWQPSDSRRVRDRADIERGDVGF